MKGFKKKIDSIIKILGDHDLPKKPFVLNDVKIDEFQAKMNEFTENYVYFNQDKNLVKSSEVLAEMFIYVLVTANKQGMREIFEPLVHLVCDDIIKGTQHDEDGHRIPIVTQGNHKIINMETDKLETFNIEIDNLIFSTIKDPNKRDYNIKF